MKLQKYFDAIQKRHYIKSIIDGHGVIIIAHSQGNLFTNRVYNDFTDEGFKRAWMKQYISAIGVASPANNILGQKTPYMTFDNDMIWLVPDHLPTNVTNPKRYYFKNALGEQVETIVSVEAHSFLTSYMATDITRGKILKFINEKVVLQRDDKTKRPSQWKPKNIGCICKDKYAKMTHKFDPEGMNQYLSNEKVKDFSEGEAGKLYRVDVGDHFAYVRALYGGKTIETVDEVEACYVLKDDAVSEMGKIEGRTEALPPPKAGAIEVTLTWDDPSIDFDLHVGWNAGEQDVKDTGCPMEHFYVKSNFDIYPGDYPISITHKKVLDDETSLIPTRMKLMVKGASQKLGSGHDASYIPAIYELDINKTEDLDFGHVADIHVEYVNGEVKTVVADPIVEPVYIPHTGGSGSGSVVWWTPPPSYYTPSEYHYVPIDSTQEQCNMSCGCIPCEYTVIPYLEQMIYGPLGGADVTLYEAVDYTNKTPLYVGKTSNGGGLYNTGNIEIPSDITQTLNDDTLYLLAVKGVEI
jgi:hypothetical protein